MNHRFLPGLILALCAGAANAALEISIRGGEVRPVPIAVVPFQSGDDENISLDVGEVVQNDLVRSGLFTALPRGDMLERPAVLEDVQFGNWRALGVEHLIIGRIRPGELGNWLVEFRLLDVYRGQQSIWHEIPASRDGLRQAAHRVSDLIYEKLTGHKGVFNTQIAYVTADGGVDERRYRLLIADADGYNARVLARSSDPIMSPAWAPDGLQMAFVAFEHGRSAIYLKTIASPRVRKLTDEPGINGAPAWSPDGRKLAVTLSRDGNPEIYLVDVVSGQRQRLTENLAIDTEPSFSPDGRHILFTSDRGGRAQIYRMPATGGEAERLTFDGRSNARGSYAPDGESIALVHQDTKGYRIAVMDLKTRELVVLSDGPLDESPSFAPNGVVIIYSTRGRAGAELATVTRDTRIRQQLRQQGDVREPAWSPFPQ